jgi:L-rhamnonate dehydratase
MRSWAAPDANGFAPMQATRSGARSARRPMPASRLVAQGFTAVKFGWHPLGLDAEADEAIVRTLREAIGPDRDLLIDAGMARDAGTALARCERFAPHRLFWLEEPLQAYDVAGYSALAEATEIPIAAGETAASYAELARLVEAGGVNVLQVDVSRTGLTEAMRVAALAERFGVPCVDHTYSYLLNAAASLHFMAAVHETSLDEHQATPNQMRDRLTRASLRRATAGLRFPQARGLASRWTRRPCFSSGLRLPDETRERA